MSSGERSCLWYGKEEQPCKPEMGTCNVDCEHFQSDGTKPDTVSQKRTIGVEVRQMGGAVGVEELTVDMSPLLEEMRQTKKEKKKVVNPTFNRAQRRAAKKLLQLVGSDVQSNHDKRVNRLLIALTVK